MADEKERKTLKELTEPVPEAQDLLGHESVRDDAIPGPSSPSAPSDEKGRRYAEAPDAPLPDPRRGETDVTGRPVLEDDAERRG